MGCFRAGLGGKPLWQDRFRDAEIGRGKNAVLVKDRQRPFNALDDPGQTAQVLVGLRIG